MVTTRIISDPVGDMLIRMKNASMGGIGQFEVSASHERERVLSVLQKKGLISRVEKAKSGNFDVLLVTLADPNRVIEIKRISKPGRRLYIKHNELYSVKGGRGFLLLSTSKGVLTESQAQKMGVGGELIAELV
ncbi:30S ribosomal protein S8 [Candidatus Roizmanbacteria bacterium CG10_big_fil_rev_8_21_14_0_10_45_7]|uniref:Small ribosomal subunit protein uS8 n=1 Tax=Candidatus Roizmanbacteria bacterium CG10_big_fil_rev_8_21_14_0_10_45_7 TaxID=1974854 RepID=A0A2M8KU82_9BACT|nr:MAG: 30S ribosomal protein S8 [Candidatus Roizmanbacteria bacterium CG10_big_fil_rev_8_21_14_0_10_45_7]